MSVRLNLVVAHKLEAKPLVRLFELNQVSKDPAIYKNNPGVQLIISGEGCEASARAVNHLAEMEPDNTGAAWLNIGIAGHQSLSIGEALLANKIVQRRDGAVAYPVLLASSFLSGELHTVDEPEFAFPANVAYDMEAFGFYSAAKQYTTLELIQCFKIISDNAEQDAGTVTAQRVMEVLAENCDQIEQLVEEMLQLQHSFEGIIAEPDELKSIVSSVHLSVTQQSQLRRLLQRFYALDRQHELHPLIESASDSRQLISSLQSRLRQIAY